MFQLTIILLLVNCLSIFIIVNAGQPIYEYQSLKSCNRHQYFDSISYVCRNCSTRYHDLIQNSRLINGGDEDNMNILKGHGDGCVCIEPFRLKLKDNKIVCSKVECLNDDEIMIDGKCGQCMIKDCKCSQGYYLNKLYRMEEDGKERLEFECRRCEVGDQHCSTCHETYFLHSDTFCNCPKETHVEEDGMCLERKQLISEDNLRTLSVVRHRMYSHVSHTIYSTLRASIFNCMTKKNVSACQYLLNQCSLKYFIEMDNVNYEERMSLCNFINRMITMLDITIDPFYVNDYHETPIEKRYQTNDVLQLVTFNYAINGTFLQLNERTHLNEIFLCHNETLRNGQLRFGVGLHKQCTWRASQLWHYAINNNDNRHYFHELFLQSNGKLFMAPVKAYYNQLLNQNVYFKRFFLIDSTLGIDLSTKKHLYIAYARSLTINIQLSKYSGNGRIYPPVIEVRYGLLESNFNEDDSIITELNVIYSMNDDGLKYNLNLALTILTSLAVIISIFRTWTWSKRSGEEFNMSTVTVFIIKLLSYIANILIILSLGVIIVYYLIFKYQSIVHLVLLTPEQETTLIVYLVIASILKLIHLIYELYLIVSIDIFFIDWEKPKKERGEKSADSLNTKRMAQKLNVTTSTGGGAVEINNVIIWRSYFIANEWFELSLCRRVNWSIHVIVMILFLECWNCKLMTRYMSGGDSVPMEWLAEVPESCSARIAYGSIVFILLAGGQYLYQKYYNENFGSNKFNEFIDLCSVGNISVFCLKYNKYGFYLHGITPNGRSDVNMLEMYEFLENEESDLCSKRGLILNTDEQTFEIYLPIAVHNHWRQLRQNIDKNQSNLFRLMRLRDIDKETVVSTYTLINRFLINFIEHTFSKADYTIADKTNFESLLDFESAHIFEKGFFYNDNRQIIENFLFYGIEITLLLFELLIFLMIDLLVQNYIIDSIVTYLVCKLIRQIYFKLSRNNLVQRTLMDERFLI